MQERVIKIIDNYKVLHCKYLIIILVVEPRRRAWKKIKQEFGDAVLHPSGELNREALGEIIFENKELRKKLNEITHPEIYKEMTLAAIKCFFQGMF